MATQERLMVLENSSAEHLSESWDGVVYTFAPGERKTLVYGVGLHFREHHPELKEVEEQFGEAPHVLVNKVTVVNRGGNVLELMWDGHPYHFEPGATAVLEEEIAGALVLQARSKGGELMLTTDDQFADPAVPAHEPETREEVRADEPPAPQPSPEENPKKLRAKRSRKASKPEVE